MKSEAQEDMLASFCKYLRIGTCSMAGPSVIYAQVLANMATNPKHRLSKAEAISQIRFVHGQLRNQFAAHVDSAQNPHICRA
jgi:hypothetical protein